MMKALRCPWSSTLRGAALAALYCLASAASGQDAKRNDGDQLDPPREWKERLDVPFSKGLDAQPGMRLFGTDAASGLAKAEPQGLRLRLPEERDGLADVGVELSKKIRGDFEITLAYELIILPVPGPAGGACAVLWAFFATEDGASGSRERKIRAFFGSTFYTVNSEGRMTGEGLSILGQTRGAERTAALARPPPAWPIRPMKARGFPDDRHQGSWRR